MVGKQVYEHTQMHFRSQFLLQSLKPVISRTISRLCLRPNDMQIDATLYNRKNPHMLQSGENVEATKLPSARPRGRLMIGTCARWVTKYKCLVTLTLITQL